MQFKDTTLISDRTFQLLYAHRFLFAFASAGAASFEYAYLLRHGASLTAVTLFEAADFFISGATALCFVKLQQRLKLSTLFTLSAVLIVIGSFLVAQASWSLPLALCSPIFSGCAIGLYYPAANVLEAIYVSDEQQRGRQYSFGVISSILGAALGTALEGVLIGHFGYWASALASALFYAASIRPIQMLPPHVSAEEPVTSPRETLRYMNSSSFRGFAPVFLGEALSVVMKTLLPAFVFLVLGSFEETGFVIAGSIVLQIVLLALSGSHLDQYERSIGMRRAAWFNGASCAAFLCVPFTAGTIVFLNAANRITGSILDSAEATRIHSLVRQRSAVPIILFGTAWLTAICALEGAVLVFVALLAAFAGNDIFQILFIGGAIGALVRYYRFPKEAS